MFICEIDAIMTLWPFLSIGKSALRTPQESACSSTCDLAVLLLGRREALRHPADLHDLSGFDFPVGEHDWVDRPPR